MCGVWELNFLTLFFQRTLIVCQVVDVPGGNLKKQKTTPIRVTSISHSGFCQKEPLIVYPSPGPAIWVVRSGDNTGNYHWDAVVSKPVDHPADTEEVLRKAMADFQKEQPRRRERSSPPLLGQNMYQLGPRTQKGRGWDAAYADCLGARRAEATSPVVVTSSDETDDSVSQKHVDRQLRILRDLHVYKQSARSMLLAAVLVRYLHPR